MNTPNDGYVLVYWDGEKFLPPTRWQIVKYKVEQWIKAHL